MNNIRDELIVFFIVSFLGVCVASWLIGEDWGEIFQAGQMLWEMLKKSFLIFWSNK